MSDWKKIEIDHPEDIDNAPLKIAKVVSDHIESTPVPIDGIHTFRYEVGNLKSMAQVDVSDPKNVKTYHYNSLHMSMIVPLEKGLRMVFPDNQVIDISGKSRVSLARDENVSNFQITKPRITEDSELHAEIIKYREAEKEAALTIPTTSTPRSMFSFFKSKSKEEPIETLDTKNQSQATSKMTKT